MDIATEINVLPFSVQKKLFNDYSLKKLGRSKRSTGMIVIGCFVLYTHDAKSPQALSQSSSRT